MSRAVTRLGSFFFFFTLFDNLSALMFDSESLLHFYPYNYFIFYDNFLHILLNETII